MITGEPVFVGSPEEKTEDDGVILVVCHDENNETSCLIVLSAETMQEIARTYTPNHIPASLHGAFYK